MKIKNKIFKWLIFLRFYFPEISLLNKVLFLCQLFFFISSVTLFFLHIDKLNIAIYHLTASIVFFMSMNYLVSKSFKL